MDSLYTWKGLFVKKSTGHRKPNGEKLEGIKVGYLFSSHHCCKLYVFASTATQEIGKLYRWERKKLKYANDRTVHRGNSSDFLL